MQLKNMRSYQDTCDVLKNVFITRIDLHDVTIEESSCAALTDIDILRALCIVTQRLYCRDKISQ